MFGFKKKPSKIERLNEAMAQFQGYCKSEIDRLDRVFSARDRSIQGSNDKFLSGLHSEMQNILKQVELLRNENMTLGGDIKALYAMISHRQDESFRLEAEIRALKTKPVKKKKAVKK